MKLYQCGPRKCTSKLKPKECLGQYFLDQLGNMYSLNTQTYCTKYGYRMHKLSDESCNQMGQLHNTVRTTLGLKVTVTRAELINKFLNKTWEVDPETYQGAKVYGAYYRMLQGNPRQVCDHRLETRSLVLSEFGHGMCYLLAAMTILLIFSLYL